MKDFYKARVLDGQTCMLFFDSRRTFLHVLGTISETVYIFFFWLAVRCYDRHDHHYHYDHCHHHPYIFLTITITTIIILSSSPSSFPPSLYQHHRTEGPSDYPMLTFTCPSYLRLISLPF